MAGDGSRAAAAGASGIVREKELLRKPALHDYVPTFPYEGTGRETRPNHLGPLRAPGFGILCERRSVCVRTIFAAVRLADDG